MTLAQQAYKEVLDRDEERNRILLEQLPQVRYIARKIHERLPKHVALDDLIHAGVLGLVDAFNKYDHRKNVQFKSYANFRIRGAILDSLRDLDWSPRDLRRKARQLEEANSRLETELGRMVTEQELASELGMELDEFQRMLTEIDRLDINSLQAEWDRGDTSQNFEDTIPGQSEENPFDQCSMTERKEQLATAIAELSEKEQQVLALYYYEDLTMKEVGEVLGIGESRVSQIHSLALVRLRSRIGEKESTASAGVLIQPTESGDAAWRRF